MQGNASALWLAVGALAATNLLLAALLVAIGAVRLLSTHLQPVALILAGLTVWLGAALLLEWAVREWAARRT